MVKNPNFHKVSIVIPLYNEENTISELLERVKDAFLPEYLSREIVVVDDGSQDRSLDLVKSFLIDYPRVDLVLLESKTNNGKGSALRKGINRASGDIILIQDADLEYDPSEYMTLLEPILSGNADVVYGSRFVGGQPKRKLFFWHSIGNRLLTLLCNMVCNLNMTDMETCYKVWNADIIKSIGLKENGFGFEPEVTIKTAFIPDIRIYEVGISYYGRTYAEGKKINYKDGFRAIYCIIKYGIFKRLK